MSDQNCNSTSRISEENGVFNFENNSKNLKISSPLGRLKYRNVRRTNNNRTYNDEDEYVFDNRISGIRKLYEHEHENNGIMDFSQNKNNKNTKNDDIRINKNNEDNINIIEKNKNNKNPNFLSTMEKIEKEVEREFQLKEIDRQQGRERGRDYEYSIHPSFSLRKENNFFEKEKGLGF